MSAEFNCFEAAEKFVSEHQGYIYRYLSEEQQHPSGGVNCVSKIFMVDEFFANAQLGVGANGFEMPGVTNIVCRDRSGISRTGNPYDCEIELHCGGEKHRCEEIVYDIYGRENDGFPIRG